MNILYLCQVFETGRDPGSDRHFFFSKHAVNSGHHVSAITSNVDYKKAQLREECRNGVNHQNLDGVDIYYAYSYSAFRGSFFKRFLYYITFFFSGIYKAVSLKEIDVVYAVSTPLTVGFMGAVVSILKRKPFVFEVTDVWPDAAVECGVVKNGFLIFCARMLEKFCYWKASHIVGLTSGICDRIAGKGVSESKISLVTNGINVDLYAKTSEPSSKQTMRKRSGFAENDLIAMYMGAHGKYNSLGTIIEAAVFLKDRENLKFIFIGDGDERKVLIQLVQEHSLTNVFFLDPVPRNEAAAYLSMADMFLLPNRKGDFFKCNLPNKLFDFCAAARPVLVAGIGESANLVERADCGIVVPPEDVESFAAAIGNLSDMSSEERLNKGMNGRRYVFENYNRKNLCDKQLEILMKASGQTKV